MVNEDSPALPVTDIGASLAGLTAEFLGFYLRLSRILLPNIVNARLAASDANR